MMHTIKEWIRKALTLLDYVLDIIRPRLSFLKRVAPSHAHTAWIYINGACCMLTAMYFLMGWLPDKTVGSEYAHMTYIPFNLVVCLIWFVEASLWMLFDEDEPAWHKLGEFLLSCFFIIDGIIWLYEWVFNDEPVTTLAMLIYSAIDFVIYLFYLGLAVRAEAKAAKEALKAQGTGAGDAEAGGAGADAGIAMQSPSPDGQPQEAQADFKLMT